MYIKLNNFAVYLKLTQYCKSTTVVWFSFSVVSRSLRPSGV